MEQYCLITRLLEKPSVRLYYNGMEDDMTVPCALNVVVAFTQDGALYLDENTAVRLCNRLNEDRNTLQAHGYSEFEITKITSRM